MTFLLDENAKACHHHASVDALFEMIESRGWQKIQFPAGKRKSKGIGVFFPTANGVK